MRLGVVLTPDGWDGRARAAEQAGLDCVLVRETALAAALAAVTSDLRVLVEIPVGSHPVGLAEELAVCDLLLQGRLTAVLAEDDPETCEVLEQALAGRRFRHDGPRWTFPREGTIVVTPAPAQVALPVWPAGAVTVRPARLETPGDVDRIVAELRGLDTGLCVLELESEDAIRLAGTRVRPQLQGIDLPPDLVASWD